MISLIRVATAVNKVVPADSDGCLKNLWECVDCLKEDNPDIIVLPHPVPVGPGLRQSVPQRGAAGRMPQSS